MLKRLLPILFLAAFPSFAEHPKNGNCEVGSNARIKPHQVLRTRATLHPYFISLQRAASNSSLVRAVSDLHADFSQALNKNMIVDLSDFGDYLLEHPARRIDLIHALQLINRLLENGRIYTPTEARVEIPLGGLSYLLFEEAELWVDQIPRPLLIRTLRNLLHIELAYYFNNQDPDVTALSSYMGRIFIEKAIPLIDALGAEDPIFKEYDIVLAKCRKALQLVSHYDQLPASWKKVLRNRWLLGDLQQLPRLSGLRTVDWKKGERLVLECGVCPEMDKGHISGLSPKTIPQLRSTLLYVGDVLVGAVKYEGEGSMLALNDIADKDGRPLVVRGMVYAISHPLVSTLRSTIPHPAVLRLDAGIEFPVHPKISLLPTKCGSVSGRCFKNYISKLAATALF